VGDAPGLASRSIIIKDLWLHIAFNQWVMARGLHVLTNGHDITADGCQISPNPTIMPLLTGMFGDNRLAFASRSRLCR